MVYIDRDDSLSYTDSVTDIPYRYGQAYLRGTDVFGVSYGPDPALYPDAYNAIFGPAAPVPANYTIQAPEPLSFQGEFFFTSLKPGSYNLYFPTPTGFTGLVSSGGIDYTISGSALFTGPQL